MAKVVGFLLVVSLCLLGNASAATLLVSPIPTEENAVSLDVAVNQVRYEVPTGRFYVSRSIVALSWMHESFFGSLGYIPDTDFGRDLELGRSLAGEAGFMLAAGARGALWQGGGFSVNAHAQVHALSERVLSRELMPAADPADDPVRVEMRRKLRSQELLVGVTAAWERPAWRLYAGFDTVPYNRVETSLPGYEDMKRADFISVRAGGGASIGPVSLSLDGQALGTKGLRLGIAFAF